MKARVWLSLRKYDRDLALFAMARPALALLIIPYLMTSLAADQEPLDRAEVLRRVLHGLAANDRALGAVQLHLLETSERPGVQGERVVTEQRPSGATVGWTEAARTSRTARATLDGDRCRYDYLDGAGAIVRTITAEGERWSEYQPDRRALFIRRLDQMASLVPIDPRESGMYDIRLRMVPTLRDGVVKDVTALRTDGAGRVYRVVVQDAFGQTLDIDFSESFSLLPVSTTLRARGRVLRHTRIEYQKVEDRGAWLLKRAITHCFDRTTDDPEAPNWAVAITRTVTDVKLLGSSDEAFKPALPQGVRVRDLREVQDGKPAKAVSFSPGQKRVSA